MIAAVERIRALVERRGEVANRDVAQALRVSPATSHRLLQALVIGRVLERIGRGRAARYRLRPLRHRFRLAGLEEGHTPDQKRERLARALEPAGATPETVELLTDALALPPDTARSPLELSPQKRKQKTLEALLQLVLGAAARRPVLLVVEDLHWLDPSSDEVLETLVRQCTGAAVLVVATARPPASPIRA